MCVAHAMSEASSGEGDDDAIRTVISGRLRAPETMGRAWMRGPEWEKARQLFLSPGDTELANSGRAGTVEGWRLKSNI